MGLRHSPTFPHPVSPFPPSSSPAPGEDIHLGMNPKLVLSRLHILPMSTVVGNVPSLILTIGSCQSLTAATT